MAQPNSVNASAALTFYNATRMGSKNASLASFAPQLVQPTASTSKPPKIPIRCVSAAANATPRSITSITIGASSAVTALKLVPPMPSLTDTASNWPAITLPLSSIGRIKCWSHSHRVARLHLKRILCPLEHLRQPKYTLPLEAACLSQPLIKWLMKRFREPSADLNVKLPR